MFESLSDRLQNIIANTTREKELTQDNMKEALREIRRSLLGADVNLRVVKSFISNRNILDSCRCIHLIRENVELPRYSRTTSDLIDGYIM